MADLREDELEAMLSSLDSRDFHSPVSGDGLGARELASGAKRPGEPEPEPRIGWRDLRRLERQPLGPAAEGAGAAPGSAGSEQNMGFEGALGSESGLRSAGGGAESAVTERLSQASSEQSREDVVSFQGTDAAGGRGAAPVSEDLPTSAANVHARLLSARKQQLLLQQRQIADSPQKEWGTKDQGLVGSGTPEQVDGELMQIQEAEALASEAAALQLQLGLEGAEERPAMSISELATGGGESQLKTNASDFT